MTDDQQGEACPEQSSKDKVPSVRASETKVGSRSPGGGDGSTTKAGKAPDELTPEEQMELYENDLKENDWGHQPC